MRADSLDIAESFVVKMQTLFLDISMNSFNRKLIQRSSICKEPWYKNNVEELNLRKVV